GGNVVPVFTTNQNIAGSVIQADIVTIAAGPRINYGDMGPITNTFTFLPDPDDDDDANFDSDGDGGDAPTVVYNTTFAPDGTRQLSGFVVTFDRPVLAS